METDDGWMWMRMEDRCGWMWMRMDVDEDGDDGWMWLRMEDRCGWWLELFWHRRLPRSKARIKCDAPEFVVSLVR